MRVKGDASGLDELQQQIEDAYFNKLIEIGRDAIRVAFHASGAPGYPKQYQNHTWNLRNAPGFCVVRGGKIVHLEVGDDGGHPEAKKNTENLLIYSEHPRDGLYLADGMFYASFVESKGYDVLRNAILYAKKMVNK